MYNKKHDARNFMIFILPRILFFVVSSTNSFIRKTTLVKLCKDYVRILLHSVLLHDYLSSVWLSNFN